MNRASIADGAREVQLLSTPDGRWFIKADVSSGTKPAVVVSIELTREELTEMVDVAAQLLGNPRGGCPACHRKLRTLDEAFCETHRTDYRLSSAGQLGRQRGAK